jgi:RNA polymerase-binding transcription factor DksA
MAATKPVSKSTPVTAKKALVKASHAKKTNTPLPLKNTKPTANIAPKLNKQSAKTAHASEAAEKKSALIGLSKKENDTMTKKTIDTKAELKTEKVTDTKADVKPAKKAKANATAAPEPLAENNVNPDSNQAASNGAENKNGRHAATKKDDVAEPKKASGKSSSKVAIKYDPDFTRSVLDPNYQPVEPSNSANRYNDSDLVEFRELINRKLESAKKELAYLQGVITRKDDTGGDNDDARYMTMEDGSLSMEREQLSQMASRQITYIDHLEKALIRIENKTYGICRVTGKLIDKARLRAVPHATLSVEAKMGKAKA